MKQQNSGDCGIARGTPITRRSVLGMMLGTPFAAAMSGAGIALPAVRSQEPGDQVVPLKSRLEPFIDRHLISELDGAALRLTEPVRKEIVLVLDQPWEGPASAYYTVFQDGDKVRLYYRGYCPSDRADQQVTCYAESTDGIHFRRPELGLFEFQGSRANNIVFRGVEAHNLAPFRDTNPAATEATRYKAVAGVDGKLFAFTSGDGIRWSRIQEEPVITQGAFDSLNVAFWDAHAGVYRCYSRVWTSGGYAGYRTVQSCTSHDFVHWSIPVPNKYEPEEPREHYYTNATTPHPDAPHILLSFPMRFVPDRTKLLGHPTPGVSDAVFITSRDGLHWNRTFREAWLRPGPDERNWTHRNIMPAWGIVLTGDEFSFYVSEHYDWPDNRLRRVAVPRNRLAGVHAGADGGVVTTKPLDLEGCELRLNYATSAAGSVYVELLHPDGTPVPGFTASDFRPLYGDEQAALLRWGEHTTKNCPVRSVRVRMRLADADVYALSGVET